MFWASPSRMAGHEQMKAQSAGSLILFVKHEGNRLPVYKEKISI